MTTYWIEGGLGKHIMFTALLKLLEEKHGERVGIVCAYPDIFKNHPSVACAWDISELDKSKNFKMLTDNLIYSEPYKGNFYLTDRIHLLKHWCDELGVPYSPELMPHVEVPYDVEMEAKITAKQLGDFIIVQFTGGQPPLMYEKNMQYNLNEMIVQRNYPYPLAKNLVQKIREKYPTLNIVDFSLPNEYPQLQGTIRQYNHYMKYIALIQHAKTFIGIDSSLAHMAAAKNKPGIVLWGGTSFYKFGWKLHKNITNYNNITPFNPNDPSYIAIDYLKIIEELDKFMADSNK